MIETKLKVFCNDLHTIMSTTTFQQFSESELSNYGVILSTEETKQIWLDLSDGNIDARLDIDILLDAIGYAVDAKDSIIFVNEYLDTEECDKFMMDTCFTIEEVKQVWLQTRRKRRELEREGIRLSEG